MTFKEQHHANCQTAWWFKHALMREMSFCTCLGNLPSYWVLNVSIIWMSLSSPALSTWQASGMHALLMTHIRHTLSTPRISWNDMQFHGMAMGRNARLEAIWFLNPRGTAPPRPVSLNCSYSHFQYPDWRKYLLSFFSAQEVSKALKRQWWKCKQKRRRYCRGPP